MDRDQLMAEIKKMLQEELQNYSRPLTDKISDEHKEKAVEIKNEVNNFVKENPWIAIGAAALVGYFVARILTRKDD